MFITLTLNVACVFLMMVPGFIARKRHWLDDNSSVALSKLMLFFCYPCLIFSSITSNYSLAELASAVMLPAGSAGIMLTGYLIGRIYCQFNNNIRSDIKRSFIFQCTINNYSFFPMAIIISMFGNDMVAGLILSTLGAEITLWTCGLFTISGQKLSIKSLKALMSPPLLGLYTALATLCLFHIFKIDKNILTDRGTMPFYLHNTLKTIGQGTVPLAMTIAGARISQLKLHDVHNKIVYILTALRLLVIPIVAIFIIWTLPISQEYKTILYIVAVMPVSLNSLLINELYGGNRELVTGSVLLSHLLALITIPLLLNMVL